MTLAKKLRFLADRMEDEKPFLIGGGEYVFDKNTLYAGDYLGIVDINKLRFAELKLKPQWEFTEDEKVILRNLPDDFRWIARDEEKNRLYVYTSKPSKAHQQWQYIGSSENLRIFNHLFQSIQWSDDEPCEFRKYL